MRAVAASLTRHGSGRVARPDTFAFRGRDPTHVLLSSSSNTHQYPAGAAAAHPVRLQSTASPKPNNSINNDDSSILSSATSYLTALRLRAVSALATSLTDVERDEILNKLSAVDKSGAEVQATKTIGEAVAKERITHEVAMAKAEAATRRREMERWQNELEAEMEHEHVKEKAGEEDASIESESTDGEDENAHPILGIPMVDLGYKRVHTVSARALSAVPIWERQRVYRHDRARTMASDKMKSLDTGLPGIITLHEDTDGQLSILDGQHRVGMMAILQDKRDKVEDSLLDLDRILVEVFPNVAPESRPKHAEDIFVEINKAEPVKLVDLPGVATGSERKVIDGAADALRSKYPEMFKPSQRCRAPHLNLDNMRDALFASDVLKRHSIKSDKALLNWMEEKNMEMAARFAEQGANGSKTASKNVSKSALAKAEKFQFFLGLDSSWLYQ